MNIKKIIASVFAATIVSATVAVTAYAEAVKETKSYKEGYSYTLSANAMSTTTKVLQMIGQDLSPTSFVQTVGTNFANGTMYLESGVSAQDKNGKDLAFNADGKYCGRYGNVAVVCSDCSSDVSLYKYVHDTSLFGNITVSSSKVASIILTVTVR